MQNATLWFSLVFIEKIVFCIKVDCYTNQVCCCTLYYWRCIVRKTKGYERCVVDRFVVYFKEGINNKWITSEERTIKKKE